MIIINKATSKGFFKGDEVKATGKKDLKTYSIGFYELEFLEGHLKGEKIWQPVTFTD